MSKVYTVDDISKHREQAFLAGRITEAQSLRVSYASRTYNPHLYRAISNRIKRYKKKIENISFRQESTDV